MLADYFQNIFPRCENGEILYCHENKSNETLDEKCKKMLLFTSENSTCFCPGSNDRMKRNSKNILREGWSLYTRLYLSNKLIDRYALKF